ncbi:MAG: protein-L-isoaspartate(D-aspartate) O-methyltransferase [Acidobacteria bacterium]|nr:protein-L-isoaspartate(D-aspartate) O-methyltransferase [Acidobacteriota bacterium]
MTQEDFAQQREKMVETQLKSRDIQSERVLEAMKKVPRHLFMPESVRQYAYIDSPVPIGEGQTISQPYIVGLMTQTVDPKPGDRALEVGTGSGYQAAVLGELVQEVYTIEIIPDLAERAEKALAESGYDNVEVRQGDGYQGWPEKAPFDIILITAAPEEIPQPLIDQLAEGGRLVVPVGPQGEIQTLTLVTREKGEVKRTYITDVRFVPMTGEVQQLR